LTAEGTTSKGTGSISCEVEFCIFYRLSLRTLRTKDVFEYFSKIFEISNVLLLSEKNNGYFTCRPIYMFDHISLSSS
jgi:hypothetical protein